MMDKMIITAYGLFLLMGAYFGAKAGSKVSMIMGLVSGGLVFLGLYLTGAHARNGFFYLTLVSGFLTGTFLMRLLKTQKFMPSGMLLAITLIFFVFCFFRFSKS